MSRHNDRPFEYNTSWKNLLHWDILQESGSLLSTWYKTDYAAVTKNVVQKRIARSSLRSFRTLATGGISGLSVTMQFTRPHSTISIGFQPIYSAASSKY